MTQTFTLHGAVALVTGANRGLGRLFAEQLLQRGAARVYAAARRPETIDLPGVVPMRLDITDETQVRAAAARAGDVTLLVNNAGISRWTDLLTSDLAEIRRELDTNFWGTLAMTRAFAPALAAKAAQWALTNGARMELAGQGTLVTALHLRAVDTDFSAGYDGPKGDPADTVRAGLDGLEAGAAEVLADDWSEHVKRSLAGDPAQLYDEIRAGIV